MHVLSWYLYTCSEVIVSTYTGKGTCVTLLDALSKQQYCELYIAHYKLNTARYLICKISSCNIYNIYITLQYIGHFYSLQVKIYICKKLNNFFFF